MRVAHHVIHSRAIISNETNKSPSAAAALALVAFRIAWCPWHPTPWSSNGGGVDSWKNELNRMNAGARREEEEEKSTHQFATICFNFDFECTHTRTRHEHTIHTRRRINFPIRLCIAFVWWWIGLVFEQTYTVSSHRCYHRYSRQSTSDTNEIFARNSRAMKLCQTCVVSALWSRTGIKCWIDFHRLVFPFLAFSVRLSQQIRRNEFSCRLFLFSSFVARCEH